MILAAPLVGHPVVWATSILEWLTLSAVVSGLSAFWFKHNCHEHGCLRLSWHPDKDGHPICKKHHEDHPSLGWFKSDKTHPRHRKAKALAD